MHDPIPSGPNHYVMPLFNLEREREKKLVERFQVMTIKRLERIHQWIGLFSGFYFRPSRI